MSTVLRYLFTGILLTIFFVLALLCGAVFTQTGARMIWEIADRNLDIISGRLVGGTVAEGLSLEDFSLDLGFMSLEADRIRLDWDLGDILSSRLVLNELDAGNIRMGLAMEPGFHDQIYDRCRLDLARKIWAGEPVSHSEADCVLEVISSDNRRNEADKMRPSYVDLPLEIVVRSARVASYTLDSSLFLLQVKDLSLSAELRGHAIEKADAAASMVDFFLRDQPPARISTLPLPVVGNGLDPQEVSAKIGTLPTVNIPFDIDIAHLDFKNIRYHMSGYDTDLIDLDLRGRIRQSLITLTPAVLKSRQYGDFTIRGTVMLQDYLPLNLDLDGTVQYDVLDGQIRGLPVKAKVGGQLTELAVDLETTDERRLKASALMNVLDGAITSKVSVSYDHVTWPLKVPAGSEPVADLKKGKATFQGSLADYSRPFAAALASDARLQGGKTFHAEVDAGGTETDLQIKKIRLESSGRGSLELAAGIHLGEDQVAVRDLILETQGNVINPVLGREDPAVIGGKITGAVLLDLKNSTADFALEQSRLEGSYGEEKFTYKGELSGQVPWEDPVKASIHARSVEITAAGAALGIDGDISPSSDSNFRLSLDCPDLRRLTAPFLAVPLEGASSLKATVSGTMARPSVKFDLDAKDLAMKDSFRIPTVKLSASQTVEPAKYYFSGTTELTVPLVEAGESSYKNISLRLEGDARRHKLVLGADGMPTFKLDAILLGSLEENGHYTVRSPKIDLNTPLRTYSLVSGLQVDAFCNNGVITAKPFSFVNRSNSLIFRKLDYNMNTGAAELDLKISRFNTVMLRKFMPEDTMIGAEFNGELKVSKAAGAPWPQVAFSLKSGKGVLSNTYSQAEFASAGLEATVTPKGAASAALSLDAGSYGKLRIGADYDLNTKAARRDRLATVEIRDLDLALLAPMTPFLDVLQGKINAQGAVSEDGGNYYFDGSVNLDNGRVVTGIELVSIDKLNMKVKVARDKVNVDSSFVMGGGSAKIAGQVDLAPLYARGEAPGGEIRIKASALELMLAGYGRSKIDLDLLLAHTVRNGAGRFSATGRVDIPWTEILVKDIASSGQELSPDVVVIDRRGQVQEVKEAKKGGSFFDFKIDVHVGDEVTVKAFGLETGLTGMVTLSNINEDQAFNINGIIRCKNGKFHALGQNLLLRTGKIEFPGPVSNVSAFIEAIRNPDTITDASGVVVGVRVVKTVNHIDMKIFSEPPMSESEKLSYLLNGVALSAENQDTASMATTSMLLNAGLSTASNSISDITSGLGLSDFRFETTNGSQVTASAYLTKKFKVSYGVGIGNAVGELKLRYELLSRLFVQFISSTDSAVDLFYNFNF